MKNNKTFKLLSIILSISLTFGVFASIGPMTASADEATDFAETYSDLIELDAITSYEDAVTLFTALEEYSELGSASQESLADTYSKLTALKATYTLTTEKFDSKAHLDEVWNKVAHVTASAETVQDAQIVTVGDRTVLCPEYNAVRHANAFLIKDAYKNQNDTIRSFSVDVNLNMNNGWDYNSYILPYYVDANNFIKVQWTVSSNTIQIRALKTVEGTAKNIFNNIPLTDVALGDWLNFKFEYDYSGTKIKMLTIVTDAEGNVVYTSTNADTGLPSTTAGAFDVGIMSACESADRITAGTIRTKTYYDNLSVVELKSEAEIAAEAAEKFKSDHATILAKSAIASDEDITAVDAALAAYEALDGAAKALLTTEYNKLTAIKATENAYYTSAFEAKYAGLARLDAITSYEDAVALLTAIKKYGEFDSATKNALVNTYNKLVALKNTYVVTEDKFDSKLHFDEAWTTKANVTASATTTKDAEIITYNDRTVLSPEYNAVKHANLLTLNDAHKKQDAKISSFSIDVNFNTSNGLDNNSYILPYYVDVNNMVKFQWETGIDSVTGGTVASIRIMRTVGGDPKNMQGTKAINGLSLDEWVTIKFDYDYSGTNIKLSVKIIDAQGNEIYKLAGSNTGLPSATAGTFDIGIMSACERADRITAGTIRTKTYYDNLSIKYPVDTAITYIDFEDGTTPFVNGFADETLVKEVKTLANGNNVFQTSGSAATGIGSGSAPYGQIGLGYGVSADYWPETNRPSKVSFKFKTAYSGSTINFYPVFKRMGTGVPKNSTDAWRFGGYNIKSNNANATSKNFGYYTFAYDGKNSAFKQISSSVEYIDCIHPDEGESTKNRMYGSLPEGVSDDSKVNDKWNTLTCEYDWSKYTALDGYQLTLVITITDITAGDAVKYTEVLKYQYPTNKAAVENNRVEADAVLVSEDDAYSFGFNLVNGGACIDDICIWSYDIADSQKTFAPAPVVKSLGATIAVTEDDEAIKVKTGFDFRLANDIAVENNETVAYYGALLKAGTISAQDMQDALATAIETGVAPAGYVLTKRSVADTPVPGEYTVTVSNSDELENMGKCLSAIGYIITSSGKVYYSSNNNEKKDIVDGVINKSLVGLLRSVFSSVYLPDYEQNQTALNETLAEYNESNNTSFTVADVQAAVAGDAPIATGAQKALLRELHLLLYDY